MSGSVGRPWDRDLFLAPSPEHAYYLGFLLGDGSIRKEGGTANNIALTIKDRTVLEGLCDLIGLPHRCIKHKASSRPGRADLFTISFSDPKIREMAAPFGIVPRKSSRFVTPHVPPRLLPGFLRGLVDSDGYCSAVRKSPASSYVQPRIGFCGTPGLVSWFCQGLRDLGYTGNITRTDKSSTHSAVVISGKQGAFPVFHLLNGDPRLERKWRKIEDLL